MPSRCTTMANDNVHYHSRPKLLGSKEPDQGLLFPLARSATARRRRSFARSSRPFGRVASCRKQLITNGSMNRSFPTSASLGLVAAEIVAEQGDVSAA